MLEAICFQSREVLEAMRKDADLAGLKLLRVDGGAARNDMLMQMQVWIGQLNGVNHRRLSVLWDQTCKFRYALHHNKPI